MPTAAQWLAFCAASLLFLQIPGPSLMFTLGRALTVDRRDALLSVVGGELGVLVQALFVAVGLGALVAASTTLYVGVKLVGAGYVVWLGLQAIRHRRDAREALEAGSPAAAGRPGYALRTGFVVGLTNPKTVVFFLAFLPQFVDHTAPPGPQVALLGLAYFALALVSSSLWVAAAGRVRQWFRTRPRRLDWLGAAGGTVMVGVGVRMATSE
ncbi:LysE family translocator [Phycicoccus sp. CSK15P-2]|uniref:LysE family translocator n=1 Tax=Phycicoccus sp. CSK15P-2 TaxID=2807627 RepID=UPI001951502A|nr:LysE family translocator [Phycicoccus sp. CSK15P-2]MBM6404284.1 LysE family translocator [Phycicoccus sp. CSK15P-2]